MAAVRAALFDTCILIDYLNGVDAAAETFKHYARDSAISIITWMEIMVGAHRLDEAQRLATRRFLARFLKLPVSDLVAERAVIIRGERKIKLPDAIIEATAQVGNRLFLTRNTRDFKDSPGVIFPYTI
jgi:predicted nucleic acid-binding protein